MFIIGGVFSGVATALIFKQHDYQWYRRQRDYYATYPYGLCDNHYEFLEYIGAIHFLPYRYPELLSAKFLAILCTLLLLQVQSAGFRLFQVLNYSFLWGYLLQYASLHCRCTIFLCFVSGFEFMCAHLMNFFVVLRSIQIWKRCMLGYIGYIDIHAILVRYGRIFCTCVVHNRRAWVGDWRTYCP